MNFLLISDSEELNNKIGHNLSGANNALVVFSSRLEVWEMLERQDPDKGWANALENFQLVILAWMLGNENTLMILRKIRSLCDVRIMIIGQMHSEDRTEAFNNGADDILPFPLDINEFNAHINSLSRRSKKLLAKNTKIIINKSIEIDLKNNTVKENGVNISLSKIEYQLLHYLIWHQNSIVSKKELANYLFRQDADNISSVVNTHILNIRKKIKQDIITTLPKQGFLFKV